VAVVELDLEPSLVARHRGRAHMRCARAKFRHRRAPRRLVCVCVSACILLLRVRVRVHVLTTMGQPLPAR